MRIIPKIIKDLLNPFERYGIRTERRELFINYGLTAAVGAVALALFGIISVKTALPIAALSVGAILCGKYDRPVFFLAPAIAVIAYGIFKIKNQ